MQEKTTKPATKSKTQSKEEDDGDILPCANNCIYTSCYCEENVWQLCHYISHHSSDELGKVYAVFISNQHKHVPLWMQKASHAEDKPVIWDYHVILVYQRSTGSLIYDLDSILPFPVSSSEYIKKAIGRNHHLHPKFHRFFRVIPAPTFLKTFASDRSHMKTPTGDWMSPPPTYPCIAAADGSTMNLASFISMERGTGQGEVMTLADFREKFMEENG